MPAFSLLAKPARLEEAKTPPPPPPATPTSDSPTPPRQNKVTSAEHSHCQSSKSKKASRAPHQPKPQPVSTQPAKLLPTPPSTASSTIPSLSPTSTVSPLAALSVLEEIITTEVTYWAHYLSTISTTTKFATLTADSTSTGTTTPAELKAEALRQILETLPLRFKALALAYPDPDSDHPEPGLLTRSLHVLLDTLQNPEQQAELEGWYDQKLFQSRKFRPDVLNLEDEIRRLEEARMEELKGLLVMVEEMKLAAAEGLVGDKALTVLVEAMDEAGLSAAGSRDASTPEGQCSIR